MTLDNQHDDGSYALGAISPDERTAYERHLATCSFCREAVEDMAVLPGLLSRLRPEEFARLFDPTLTAPYARRTPARTRITTGKRERALGAALTALAAALRMAYELVPAQTGPTVPMTPVAAWPALSARISIAVLSGGTRVDVACADDRSAIEAEPRRITLLGYGLDGETEAMGSWVGTPGRKFTMTGVTHFAGGDLTRLALLGADGSVLLAYDVP